MMETFKLTIQGRELEFRRPKHAEFDIEDFEVGAMLLTSHQDALKRARTAKAERKEMRLVLQHMKGLIDMVHVAMQLTCTEAITPMALYQDYDGPWMVAAIEDAMAYKLAVSPSDETVKNWLAPSLPKSNSEGRKGGSQGPPSAESGSSPMTAPFSESDLPSADAATSAPPPISASTN